MPLMTVTHKVDFVGLNNIVVKEIDGNEISYTSNDYTAQIGPSDAQFFAIKNNNVNGPYGYSMWRQLRVSENPITRHHRETNKMTFVIQPGPVRNVLPKGELRVRDRYSALYSYTEPAICQKAYPLVWNVGRHLRDSDGNIQEQPEKFSIISSYTNSQIGFANEEVNKVLGFDPNEDATEYNAIKSLYLDNGLNKQDSPLTYWEFLQYRETIFPKPEHQFIDKVRNRPQFESFYRHNRLDRNNLRMTSSFGYSDQSLIDAVGFSIEESTWPLDEEYYFTTREYSSESGSVGWQGVVSPFYQDALARPVSGTRTTGPSGRAGEGVLMSTKTQFIYDRRNLINDLTSSNAQTVLTASMALDSYMSPGPLYSRRISLKNTSSVSNPYGMSVPQTGGLSVNTIFQGGALWEAGSTREIKDENGNYVSAPKKPFYDTYESYADSIRRYGKNYSVIPEFRISNQIEDYLRNNLSIEKDMFEVEGGISGSEDSSKREFYEIYSNTDFMRNFEVVSSDHEDFSNGKILSLRCKAIKKFLPYEGFYPAQRTADLSKRFYDSYRDEINIINVSGTQINNFNFGVQSVMTPLFAPGILFNTIKSGVAVDYPIMTGSVFTAEISLHGEDEFLWPWSKIDKRIPFEAIVEPQNHLAGIDLINNEPHPSGSLTGVYSNWSGKGDELYSKMANNVLASIADFFLPNGNLTSVASKKQKDITLQSGSVYGMRIKMRKSMNGSRAKVHHYNSSSLSYFPPQDVNSGSFDLRENFTMYSRPSAFGPPSLGGSLRLSPLTASIHSFDPDNETYSANAGFNKGSEMGFNFPFTPPYYHGEAWCDVVLTASSNSMTIQEIQENAEYTFTRFDGSHYSALSGSDVFSLVDNFIAFGPQSISQNRINENAVQLSSSLNLKGIGKIVTDRDRLGGTSGNLVVDTGVDEDSRWIIQTKFETPMLNFNHISEENGNLTLPIYGSESVPRGMWHQYGRIPEESEGVFLEIGEIERNYWVKARGETVQLKDLSEALGFSSSPTKIGRIAESKTISEAVVAVPFIEESGRKKFFKLEKQKVDLFKENNLQAITTGNPENQIGRSVLHQLNKMKKFVFPPSFDFLNFDDVDPIAMYIFEFSHTLTQQDLSDIWQNLPPDIAEEQEVSEIAITHPLLRKELMGAGGVSGNATIELPNNLKWMVFKVKQRAASNYFKKTVLRNPNVNVRVNSSNVTKDEFGDTSPIQYNWPYDFFSLVEMVKIDAEVEMGNISFEDYVEAIPKWEPVQAQETNIEVIVNNNIDIDLPSTETPPEEEPPPEEQEMEFTPEEIEQITESYQENQETQASQGAELVEGSQAQMGRNAQINQNLASSTIAQNSILTQGAGGELYGGVDFSSFNNLLATLPANAVTQAGIPREELANGLMSLNNMVNQYNANVAQFGQQSSQAQASLGLMNQMQSAQPAVMNSPMASNLLSANNIFLGG